MTTLLTGFLVAAATVEPAADPADTAGSAPWWLKAVGAIAALLLSSSAVAAAFGAVRAGAAARRQEYTAAARTLTAWAEYPYRIRRRTSDRPETLAALADRGHDLQEQMADRQAWCSAEHPLLGRVYEHLRSQLASNINSAIEQAWQASPVTTPAQMLLGTSFPVDTRAGELLACFNACVRERFGWRRLLGERWLRKQLARHVHAAAFGTL